MNLIPSRARLSVGRILGECPLVTDVLRAVKIVGLNHGNYRLVSTGLELHLLADSGLDDQHEDNSLAVFYTLVGLVGCVDYWYAFY
jgi:hypothetical protein